MAIDKNSKAYQNLLKSGYTDEQITQMHSDVAWGQSTQQAVANTQPTQTPQPTQTTPEVKQETVMKQQETVGSTVPEIKQEGALKPLSQDYYNQTWDMAQKQIRDNLNSYRETNPWLFSSYEDFKRNFSYNARNEEQRNTLDAWYWEYEKWMQLSGVPVTDLYTQYKDGQVSTSDLETLKIYNPTKYAELQNQINKWNIIAAYDDDKWDATNMSFQDMAYQMMQKTFMQFMNWWSDSGATQFFAEYKDRMNSPEMVRLSDESAELQEQIENVQSDIANMKKAVEKEYEWTWASRSKINAIISDRTYELQTQLQTLDSQYKRVATQYNNRMQQYSNDFELQLQEYQLWMQERNQKMDELWFAMDLMSFETPQQAQERQWNYWVMQQEYTNWDINSSNPTVQLKGIQKSVDELLANYAWIPTKRSNVQIAQDIQTAIKNGSNIGDELTKLNQQMQSKPEYRLMYNATYWGKQSLGTINWMSAVINYDANGNYTWYKLLNTEPNSIENTTRQGQINSFKDVWDMSSDWDSYYNNLVNAIKLWSWGWQCGAWANDILVWAWGSKVFWDSLSSKISVCQQKYSALASNLYNDLKAWQFAVIDTWAKLKDWTPAWHVGLITSIDLQNRTITVLDSNGQGGKGCWGQSTYSLDKVRGAYTPDIWANPNYQGEISTTVGGMSKAYEPTRVWLYDKYLNEWSAPTDAKIKAMWGGDLDLWWQIWDAEVADYMAKTGAGSLDKKKNDEVNKLRTEMHQSQAYTDYNQMQSFYQKIKNATNNKTATAASDVSLLFSYMKMLDPRSIVRESEFATAQNMGSLPTKWHAKLKSAINWKKLTDSQRTEILKEASTLMDWATYLYNNLLDDYSAMITYWGDASRLWKKWTYITEDYINAYWNTTSSTTSYNSSQRYTWLTQIWGWNNTWAGSVLNIWWNYYPSTFN